MNKIKRIKIPQFDSQRYFVEEAINNNFLTEGPHLEKLKCELSKMFKKKHIVLTNSCFSSLFLTLNSIDFKTSEKVETSAAGTCFSIINSIISSGLKPVFCDAEEKSFGMDFYNLNKFTGDYKKIIISPNYFGFRSKNINSLNKENYFIIEDAAQSFFTNTNCLSSSDVLLLSFYPTKLSNGISGGAVLTNDENFYKKLIDKVSYTNQLKYDGKKRYNFAMNNISAAFALGTLEKKQLVEQKLIDSYIKLYKFVTDLGFDSFKLAQNQIPSKFLLFCETKQIRDNLLEYLIKQDIEASLELTWTCPLEKTHFYKNTKNLIERTLSLPFYFDLKEEEIIRMVNALRSFLDL